MGEHYPYVEIIEEPAGRDACYHYEGNELLADTIYGVNSKPENRTYPTIRIVNYKGSGYVLASCVTVDEPYRMHPHCFTNNTIKTGVYKKDFIGSKISFNECFIRGVRETEIEDALRLRESMGADPFMNGVPNVEELDLNSVRICFQAFIERSNGVVGLALDPVVSAPIYNKNPTNGLEIHRLSHSSASVAGGKEIIILCETITGNDEIYVRFFETDDGRQASHCWEVFVKPTRIHNRAALVLHTPPYTKREITESLQVYLQLRRHSDGSSSEPVPFELLPLFDDNDNNDMLIKKRQNTMNRNITQLLVQALKVVEDSNERVNDQASSSTSSSKVGLPDDSPRADYDSPDD